MIGQAANRVVTTTKSVVQLVRTPTGWQAHKYPKLDVETLPVPPLCSQKDRVKITESSILRVSTKNERKTRGV
jgi:hypothetical protein